MNSGSSGNFEDTLRELTEPPGARVLVAQTGKPFAKRNGRATTATGLCTEPMLVDSERTRDALKELADLHALHAKLKATSIMIHNKKQKR